MQMSSDVPYRRTESGPDRMERKRASCTGGGSAAGEPLPKEIRLREFGTAMRNNSGSQMGHFDGFIIYSAVYGDRGVRRTMEDAHLLCPSVFAAVHGKVPRFQSANDCLVAGIFDGHGHGGKQSTNFIKDHFVEELATQIVLEEDAAATISAAERRRFSDDPLMKRIIRTTCAQLDRRIATEMPNCKDGTTAVILILPYASRTAFILNVGDASAYLARRKAPTSNSLHAICLTEAHKPWAVKEKERIVKTGATVEAGRVNGVLEVSRSFGDLAFKKYGVVAIPHITKFSVDCLRDEFVLLGTDGFWGSWTAEEALQKAMGFIQKEECQQRTVQNECDLDLRGVCRQLVDYVLIDRKSQDNISALILLIRPKTPVEKELD